MEIVILVIVAILACVFVWKFAYQSGYDADKNIKQAKADAAQEKYNADLANELASLEREIQNKQFRIHSLNNEYNKDLQRIADIRSSAENAYELKTEQLQKDYSALKKQLEENRQQTIDHIMKEVEDLNNELLSLKNTKAATIEALQREAAIQKEKDLYRLDISSQDKTDIEFLRSIQYRISKPRLISMLIWQNYFQPIAKEKFPLILGKETVCGIYKLTNTLNQLCYIGQAKNVRERWLKHAKCGLDIDRPKSNKLYAAMVEEGLENFTFELLEECSPEELDKKEQFYIEVYNSIDFGYNGRNQR